MAIDVTDATFQTDVIDKSSTVPVVVDLWAPWCGPCRTLGPIIEKAVDATEGKVVLTKVNVDENPQISRSFQVQSIPAVYAMRNGQVVDGFLGALPERDVERFVEGCCRPRRRRRWRRCSPPATSRACARRSSSTPATRTRSSPWRAARRAAAVRRGTRPARTDPRVRSHPTDRRGGPARRAAAGEAPSDDYDAKLLDLLPRVKDDDDARQQYVDILEVMGTDDPRTADYRKKLSRELF